MSAIFAALAMSALFPVAAAQTGRTFSPDMVDRAHILMGAAHYNLVQNDVLSGDWLLAGAVEEGVYRLVDGTTLYPDVRESGVWLMSADTFAPQSVSLDGDFGRNILDADLAWSDGAIAGEYRLRRPTESTRRTRAFSQPAQQGAIFRAAAFALAPGIDLSDGPVTLTWFSSLSGQHENVTLVPEGEARITTPAGTFDTRLVGVRGASTENVLYITRTAPIRLVRVDVIGQNMRMELREFE